MIPVNVPQLGAREKDLLNQCIDSGWISSDGPFVSQFEDSFADFIGMKNAVAVTNGTAALEAALFAIGVKHGDEIIMPSFTIISCAIAALRFGAKPILIDIEPLTWNINTNLIEEKITKKTKAIMAVHMYGHPCNMDSILYLAKKYNLVIIEDASQVHGALFKNRKCGSIGHISTFSFYANKILTTGEGGMVLSSNNKYAERARSYRNLCFKKNRRFFHTEIGNNLRMTNIQAALGIAQLEKIHDFVEIKRKNGAIYQDYFSKVPGIKSQIEMPWARMVYWMYAIELDEKTGLNAKKLMERLSSFGIGTRPFFVGLHAQPALRKKGWYKGEKFPVTTKSSKQGLYLPSSLNLRKKDIKFVVDHVKKILER
jgi:perosamine synthetase